MSWKMEVQVDGKWSGNGIAFATKKEAELAGQDLLGRWFVPTASRAVESDQPVNYEIVDGVQRRVEEVTDGSQ